MNQDSLRSLQINLPGVGCWLTILATIMLLGSIGLGWLVQSFFIVIGLILVTPLIVFWGFRWWLQRNLVQDQCPVCSNEFTALKKTQFNCPSCGEPLQIDQGHFHRLTPPGTIDVQAIDVSVKQLED